MADLFENEVLAVEPKMRPLADRLRPSSFEEVVGQNHLFVENAPLSRMMAKGQVHSGILWGPAGCGKTTIARLMANIGGLHFEPLSAVFSGVGDLRKVFEAAKVRRSKTGLSTILFVDEIHRFNKAQQDAFLPYVEDGLIILVGATTENPSFEINSALLSRAQLLVLNRLDDEALERLLVRAEKIEGKELPLDDEARAALKAMADGDGRFILNLAEDILGMEVEKSLTIDELNRAMQRRAPLYDKGSDNHYNLISALHKAVRGSDVDGALYWFARMIDGGEDPHYIARRMVRMAVEDIGLAEPKALTIIMDAWQAFDRLGSPEGELCLSEAVIFLSMAPKSNAGYVAYKKAMALAKKTGSLMPPKHILNAPTKMMKDIGYGKGYSYDHDAENAFSGQGFFPEELGRQEFYKPVSRGFEREMQKRLDYWEKLRLKRKKD